MKKEILAFIFILSVSFASAQHKFSCSPGEVGFGGNDLVSYFDGKAESGVEKYTTEYEGIVLRFKNYENLSTFNKDPEKYLPAYGGWCATAVTQGILTEPDYSMFKIQEGQLLFFEVKAFYNGKTQWEKNPEANQAVANKKYAAKFKDD